MKFDSSYAEIADPWHGPHQDRSGPMVYQLVEHWPIYDDYDRIMGTVAKPTPMAYFSREYAVKLARYLESGYCGEVRYSVRVWGDAAYQVVQGKPVVCEIIEFPYRRRSRQAP